MPDFTDRPFIDEDYQLAQQTALRDKEFPFVFYLHENQVHLCYKLDSEPTCHFSLPVESYSFYHPLMDSREFIAEFLKHTCPTSYLSEVGYRTVIHEAFDDHNNSLDDDPAPRRQDMRSANRSYFISALLDLRMVLEINGCETDVYFGQKAAAYAAQQQTGVFFQDDLDKNIKLLYLDNNDEPVITKPVTDLLQDNRFDHPVTMKRTLLEHELGKFAHTQLDYINLVIKEYLEFTDRFRSDLDKDLMVTAAYTTLCRFLKYCQLKNDKHVSREYHGIQKWAMDIYQDLLNTRVDIKTMVQRGNITKPPQYMRDNDYASSIFFDEAMPIFFDIHAAEAFISDARPFAFIENSQGQLSLLIVQEAGHLDIIPQIEYNPRLQTFKLQKLGREQTVHTRSSFDVVLAALELMRPVPRRLPLMQSITSSMIRREIAVFEEELTSFQRLEQTIHLAQYQNLSRLFDSLFKELTLTELGREKTDMHVNYLPHVRQAESVANRMLTLLDAHEKTLRATLSDEGYDAEYQATKLQHLELSQLSRDIERIIAAPQVRLFAVPPHADSTRRAAAPITLGTY